MPEEDDGYQYIPFPIEYMDREEASKYQDSLNAKKEAEAIRDKVHIKYLAAMQRANAIRGEDDLEYFSIKRDAKASLKEQEALYLPIIKSSEDLINKVNPESVVKPVIIEVEQHADSLRQKMDGGNPSKGAKKMVKNLEQLIAKNPETALDQFVDQMGGLNPVERKTIKAALEPDCNSLKAELAKGTFSLERRMNAPFFEARIGNLIDKISSPEYTKQEAQALGQQAQYVNRLQNKMSAVLAAGQTQALGKQVDKPVERVVVSADDEGRSSIKYAGPVSPTGRQAEQAKSIASSPGGESGGIAPPAFDPHFKYVASLKSSLSEGSTSEESISTNSVTAKTPSKGTIVR